ncbi:MAG: hypothetical protein ABH842_03460 [Candidatus Micrarchaeota archaeon]
MTTHRGVPCVYHSILIDCFVGGDTPWKRIYSDDYRIPFYLGKTLVDPNSADIRIKPIRTTTGYIKREKGIIENFFDFAVPSTTSKIIQNIISYTPVALVPDSGAPDQTTVIDDATTKTLQQNPKMKKIIAQNIKKPLKITEYAFLPKTKICICVTETEKEKVHPFLITDENEENTKLIAKEKSYLTFFVGSILFIVSVVAYVLVIQSL